MIYILEGFLIAICIYGFTEQEKNMKVIHDHIKYLEEQLIRLTKDNA